MIKICSNCEGLGYESYDLDGSNIDLSCEKCEGVGHIEAESTLVAIKMYDLTGHYIDGIILDVEDSVNRPNNPDIDEIVDAYMYYNYGDNVDYRYETTRNKIVTIDEDWNIENYK